LDRKFADISSDNCYKFRNDSVSCQRSLACGWCHLENQGFCTKPSPETFSACTLLRGHWIGEKQRKEQVDVTAMKRFVNEQYITQEMGLYPVIQVGDQFIWTINEFSDLLGYLKAFYSGIFQDSKNNYWRFYTFLPKNENELGLYIENIHPTNEKEWTYALHIQLSLVHPTNPKKSLKWSMDITTSEASPRVGKTTGYTYQGLRDEGFIQNNSIQMSVSL